MDEHSTPAHFLLLLRPWGLLSDGRARYFERELARELPPDHALHNRRFTAVAITGASDDVLLRTEDGTFAQVHLTFTKTPPKRPGWPEFAEFETLSDWVTERMLPDHVDFFGLWPD
jgi:hypothetical protein